MDPTVSRSNISNSAARPVSDTDVVASGVPKEWSDEGVGPERMLQQQQQLPADTHPLLLPENPSAAHDKVDDTDKVDYTGAVVAHHDEVAPFEDDNNRPEENIESLVDINSSFFSGGSRDRSAFAILSGAARANVEVENNVVFDYLFHKCDEFVHWQNNVYIWDYITQERLSNLVFVSDFDGIGLANWSIENLQEARYRKMAESSKVHTDMYFLMSLRFFHRNHTALFNEKYPSMMWYPHGGLEPMIKLHERQLQLLTAKQIAIEKEMDRRGALDGLLYEEELVLDTAKMKVSGEAIGLFLSGAEDSDDEVKPLSFDGLDAAPPEVLMIAMSEMSIEEIQALIDFLWERYNGHWLHLRSIHDRISAISQSDNPVFPPDVHEYPKVSKSLRSVFRRIGFVSRELWRRAGINSFLTVRLVLARKECKTEEETSRDLMVGKITQILLNAGLFLDDIDAPVQSGVSVAPE